MFAQSRDWTTVLPLPKAFSALPSELYRLLKQYVFHIVLDNELADKNVIRKLGVFIDGNVQGYSFRPPMRYQSTKQAFCCSRNLHERLCNSGCLYYRELAKFLPRAVRDECFSKRKNTSFLAIYWIRRWKIWKIMPVPMFKISLMKKCEFVRVTHSDKRRHFTVESAAQNCLLTG